MLKVFYFFLTVLLSNYLSVLNVELMALLLKFLVQTVLPIYMNTEVIFQINVFLLFV